MKKSTPSDKPWNTYRKKLEIKVTLSSISPTKSTVKYQCPKIKNLPLKSLNKMRPHVKQSQNPKTQKSRSSKNKS